MLNYGCDISDPPGMLLPGEGQVSHDLRTDFTALDVFEMFYCPFGDVNSTELALSYGIVVPDVKYFDFCLLVPWILKFLWVIFWDGCEMGVAPEEVEVPVEIVMLFEHLGSELLGGPIYSSNELDLSCGLIPLSEQGFFRGYAHRPPLFQRFFMFGVEDTLWVVEISDWCLPVTQSFNIVIDLQELLFNGPIWRIMDHVCRVCELGDHEDASGFTCPLGHHFDESTGRTFIGSPDGDVFAVEVEGDFPGVGRKAHHYGDCLVIGW